MSTRLSCVLTKYGNYFCNYNRNCFNITFCVIIIDNKIKSLAIINSQYSVLIIYFYYTYILIYDHSWFCCLSFILGKVFYGFRIANDVKVYKSNVQINQPLTHHIWKVIQIKHWLNCALYKLLKTIPVKVPYVRICMCVYWCASVGAVYNFPERFSGKNCFYSIDI